MMMFEFIILVVVFALSYVMGRLYLRFINYSGSNEQLTKMYSILIGLGIYSLSLFFLAYSTSFFINPQNFVVLSTVLLLPAYFIVFKPQLSLNALRTYLANFRQYLNDKIISPKSDFKLIPRVELALLIFVILFYLIKIVLTPIFGWDAVAVFDYKGFTIFKTKSFDYIDARIEHGLYLPLFYATFYHFTSSDIVHQLFLLIIFLISLFTLRLLYQEIGKKTEVNKSLLVIFLLSTPIILKYLFRTYADIVLAGYYSIVLICMVNAIFQIKAGDLISGKNNLKIANSLVIFLPWIKAEGIAYLGIFIMLNFYLYWIMRRQGGLSYMKFLGLSIPASLIWPIILKLIYNSTNSYLSREVVDFILKPNLAELTFIFNRIIFYLFGFELVESRTLGLSFYLVSTSLIYYFSLFVITITISQIRKKQTSEHLIFYFSTVIFLLVITTIYLMLIFYLSPWKVDPGLDWAINGAMSRQILHVTPALTFLIFKVWDENIGLVVPLERSDST